MAQRVAQAAADPPAAVATIATVATAPATAAASNSGLPLPPQPSGRLALQPSVLAAVTAPLGFLSSLGVVPLSQPTPSAAADTAAVTGVGVPLASAEPDTTVADPAAPLAVARHIGRRPLRRMFDSPMEFLGEHLLPAARSPFGLPRPFELRAQRTWPFGESLSQQLADGLKDNSVGITAVVVAALVAMTALTAAGAGLSGRPLRHTAWRLDRRRLRTLSDWVTALPDAVADGAPQRLTAEPRIAGWPGRPIPAEPLAVPRERRVA